MEEFALLFRQATANVITSEEQLQVVMKEWEAWIGGIAAQGKFIPGGRLTHTGKVLLPGGVITDGPFVELKEELLGFIIVKAADMDEAVTLAHGCPILNAEGSVEVRPITRSV